MNIESSQRLKKLPPYAFKEINDKVEALKVMALRGEALAPIDFGVGDPSEPTPDFVIEGLIAAGKKHAASGYPSYIGSLEFRQAAAAYMKRRFGVVLDPKKEISSCIGAKEAVFNFPEGFINHGDVVICPSPGYPPYKSGTLFAEGEPFYVPLLPENNFLLDYESIPAEIVKRSKIVWINYPNSPTGATASRKYYEGLIQWANKNNLIIGADEGCYIDIYYDERPLSILEVGRDGIITFYSLSKRNNMTGYRVGFVAGDSKIVDIFKLLKTNIDSGTPSIIQEAGIRALNDDGHVSDMRKIYKEKKEILLEGFKTIGLEVHQPKATFYVWQKAPEGMTDVEFATKLLDPKIAIVVTPGSLIADECLLPDGSKINPGAGYVRFALMPTLEEVKEAVKRMEENF